MTFLKKHFRYIALLSLVFLISAVTSDNSLNSGGLKFLSKQVYSGQRTSFKLFNDFKRVTKSFDLEFNCQIYNPKYFGFVFRATHASEKNSAPLMHLLFIPAQGNSGKCLFEFHFANSKKTIQFTVDTLQLNNLSFAIRGLVKERLILITLNGRNQETEFAFPNNLNMNFVFGLFGENTDVAPMILQNVRLNLNDQVDYQWPLDEFSGDIAHEKISKIESDVSNPNWMQDKHYYWEKVMTLKSDPMAGIVMVKDNTLLILNRDSLVMCDPHSLSLRSLHYANKRPFERDAFFAVFNPKNQTVIGYDFHFLKVNDGSRVYSVYDPITNLWSMPDSATVLDQNHHHCIFWNNDTSKVITFGGYSYFHYYNTFRSFDFNSGFWEKMDFSGDEIYPRTHASVNRNMYTGDYYLFGGFGNKEGSQSLEGKYFYDLYQFDPQAGKIKKLWDIDSPGFDFVPRGTLIFRPDKPLAYVLGNKPVEKSSLRLYEINLEEPEIKVVTDSIPVIFSDMSGNAFLFQNKIQNELYCVTRETTNQNYAAITVYRLIFPPSGMIPVSQTEPRKVWMLIAGLLLAFFILLTLYFIRKKNGKTITPEKPELIEKFERRKQNSIWLLNDFRVFDRNGHDITYRFATKLRHAFIVLFMESYFRNGILSADFSDLLWPSLNKIQQKNNRGVVINNLRKIFEDMDGVSILKDEMHWKISFSEKVYIDYIEVRKLIVTIHDEQTSELVLDYFSFGNLLRNETWDYVDQFKDGYSAAVIDVLTEMNRNAFHIHNHMKCIEISDVILNHFDFLNESAMVYKIKSLYILKNSSRAISEFNKFRLKYSESLSKNFQLTFDEILRLPEHFDNYLR